MSPCRQAAVVRTALRGGGWEQQQRHSLLQPHDSGGRTFAAQSRNDGFLIVRMQPHLAHDMGRRGARGCHRVSGVLPLNAWTELQRRAMPGGGGGGHHIWLETFFFPATSATAAMHLALLAAILGSTYRRERRQNREAALARPWRGMATGACGFLAPKSRLMSCWLLRPCGNLSEQLWACAALAFAGRGWRANAKLHVAWLVAGRASVRPSARASVVRRSCMSGEAEDFGGGGV